MLRNYLPKLPVRRAFEGRVIVPAHVQKAVVTGVERRNELVHKDAVPPTFEEVEQLLLAIYDLLWLYDYYAGREWAIEHLTDASRVALGLMPYGSKNLSAGKPSAPLTPPRQTRNPRESEADRPAYA